jgi:serine protease Do
MQDIGKRKQSSCIRTRRFLELFASCAAFLLLAPMLLAQAPTSTHTPNTANASDPLHQLSDSIQALVRRVSPSVVQVVVTGYGPLEDRERNDTGLVIGKQRSIGSGVILDPDGYIVTNAHVVSGAQRVQVVLPELSTDGSPIRTLLDARGRGEEARIIGVSPEIDLALLKIEAHGLPALPLAKYSNLRQGELVLAFGSPGGLRNTVTNGVVSAVARQPDPDNPMVYIQTDAPINPGNSGGPLVNVEGEVVGINTFILTTSGGNEGLGFAIPSGVVAAALPQLRKYGHIHRGEIGVEVQTITPTLASGLGLARNWGVIISDVLPDGPADKAGLQIQDIILAVDDRTVDNLPILGLMMLSRGPGQRIKVDVLRGTDKLSFEVQTIEHAHDVDQLADLVDPEKSLVSKLGVLGIEISGKIAQLLGDELREPSGVVVAARAAGTGAVNNSLKTGDVIHALNGAAITTLAGLRSALDNIKPDSPVVLQIERDGKMMYIAFQMESQ